MPNPHPPRHRPPQFEFTLVDEPFRLQTELTGDGDQQAEALRQADRDRADAAARQPALIAVPAPADAS